MNQSEKLMRAFSYVDDELLDLAERKRTRKRKDKKIYWGIIAACICLAIALPVTAIARNWFGLRDLLVPDSILEDDGKHDTIGQAGYSDSAEAQALREWNLFLMEYDQDGAILAEIGNQPSGVDSKYAFYLVYTEDMAKKLDEILQKYDLELHTEKTTLDTMESVEDFEAEFLKEGNTFCGGYVYEDGSFQMDGEAFIEGCGKVDYQIHRAVKGKFDDLILNIGKTEDYREIPYESAGEEEIILALGDQDKSLIIADFENCFVTVNVLYWEISSMTEENLRALADTFDFTALKTNFSVPEEGRRETVEDFENRGEAEIMTEKSENFYGVCTSYSKEEVEDFAKNVRQLVLARDWEKVGKLISYPIEVGGWTFDSGEEFAKGEFEDCLDESFFAAIEQETCEEMFCNWEGIMMGDGQIWIGTCSWINPEGILRIIKISP